MDSELVAALSDMIPRVTGIVQRLTRVQFGATTSKEDIEQEMWLAAAENELVLLKHLANENESAIRTVLMTAGSRLVGGELREQRAKKAAAAGYEPHDEVYYSIGSLRRLMPMYFDNDVAERPPQGRESAGKVSGGTMTYGDYLITMVDLDRAYQALPQGKQKILARYFAHPQGSGGFTHTEIAGRMGMTPGELGSRVQVALRALQRQLGGQSPWQRGPTPKARA